MQVILIQDVNNLGGINELVTVKNGYGRNFLIPSKFAVEASPSNVKMMEEKKKQQAKKEAKLLASVPSELRFPASSEKTPLATLTTPVVVLLTVGVKSAV